MNENKSKRKNFFTEIKLKFPHLSSEDILGQIKILSYEKGLKDQFAKEYEEFSQIYIPYMIN